LEEGAKDVVPFVRCESPQEDVVVELAIVQELDVSLPPSVIFICSSGGDSFVT
jgi:hypothetical protein